MATIFVSPGVYTKEQDFSVFASRIGITRLGLAGKTLKGPAFQEIKVKTTDEFYLRFGGTHPDYPLGYVANSFLGQANELTVSRVLGKTGFENTPAWMVQAGTGSTEYSGSTLAIIRSKKDGSGNPYYSGASALAMVMTSTASTLGDFVVSAASITVAGGIVIPAFNLALSMDETSENYIAKVFGKNPSVIEDTYNLYVEETYPHFVRQAVASGKIPAINEDLGYDDSSPTFTEYTSSYTHSITPWIVSKAVGVSIAGQSAEVHRLFKFHTISDGNASASEIKISIANIDDVNSRFDVIVRRFEDTDATAGATALERFSNVTLDDTQPNYIGKVIGTLNEEYPSKSSFILVELANRVAPDTVPGGFEGYKIKGDATTMADVFYKTGYLSSDTIYKTYLGTSELGYSSLTVSQISTRNAVKTLEKDLFKFHGSVTSGLTKTKGFHLENVVNPELFQTGSKSALTSYQKSTLPGYVDKTQLKFTVVPTGGFDGFDKYEYYATPNAQFFENKLENVSAFKEAIEVFANPEEVDINLFATPGVDFKDNNSIVKYALNLVEERADALYIIDSPRISTKNIKGTAVEVVNALESADIDSNYATTYWPWIQIEDTISGKYTYQAPTLFAVKVMALTDNVAAPWIAPAGLNRGLAGTSIKRTDIKLNKQKRDTLYGGRINPITSRVQQGIAIWGQKTLQIRESALDRINVRRLLLQVRRLVAAASLTLLFEQNDQALRDQFLAKVEPILLQIQNQRGLTAFKVVMDDSNNNDDTVDRNTLVGKIQLKPTRTAEFIDLTFQVLPTGANFEDF